MQPPSVWRKNQEFPTGFSDLPFTSCVDISLSGNPFVDLTELRRILKYCNLLCIGGFLQLAINQLILIFPEVPCWLPQPTENNIQTNIKTNAINFFMQLHSLTHSNHRKREKDYEVFVSCRKSSLPLWNLDNRTVKGFLFCPSFLSHLCIVFSKKWNYNKMLLC